MEDLRIEKIDFRKTSPLNAFPIEFHKAGDWDNFHVHASIWKHTSAMVFNLKLSEALFERNISNLFLFIQTFSFELWSLLDVMLQGSNYFQIVILKHQFIRISSFILACKLKSKFSRVLPQISILISADPLSFVIYDHPSFQTSLKYFLNTNFLIEKLKFSDFCLTLISMKSRQFKISQDNWKVCLWRVSQRCKFWTREMRFTMFKDLFTMLMFRFKNNEGNWSWYF